MSETYQNCQNSVKKDFFFFETLQFFDRTKTLFSIRQEPLALDGAVVRKISKRCFFQDIINSFQGETQLGLKPPQFFSFQKISTNTVARGVQILGRYGL